MALVKNDMTNTVRAAMLLRYLGVVEWLEDSTELDNNGITEQGVASVFSQLASVMVSETHFAVERLLACVLINEHHQCERSSLQAHISLINTVHQRYISTSMLLYETD